MSVVHELRRTFGADQTSPVVPVEDIVDLAVAAIARLGEAADGAGADERDRLARAATRIDEVLAHAVRAIHAPDEGG